jgi:serine/threonine-protein kinase RsbW
MTLETKVAEGARDKSITTAAEECLLVVAFDAAHLGEVRTQVRRLLTAAGLSEPQTEDFLVAVNETMTNAVTHGAGRGKIRLWRNGHVVCEVTDRGQGLPQVPDRRPPAPPGPIQPGGRGLWLAQELTDSMDVDSSPEGTRIRLGKTLRDKES